MTHLTMALAGAARATASSIAQLSVNSEATANLLSRLSATVDTQASTASATTVARVEILRNLTNKAFGNLWRDTVAAGLRSSVPEGWTVTTEEWFYTPFGNRFVDVVVRNQYDLRLVEPVITTRRGG